MNLVIVAVDVEYALALYGPVGSKREPAEEKTVHERNGTRPRVSSSPPEHFELRFERHSALCRAFLPTMTRTQLYARSIRYEWIFQLGRSLGILM